MNELIGVGILLSAIVAGLHAFAPGVSEALVRSRARRLPQTLSERMCEEWLAELGAMPGRPSQLAFAIALILTRRHSFAVDEDSLFAAPARAPLPFATFGGWRSVVVFTTIVAAALAYAASFLITPVYRSQARIVVSPQRMPARFVVPAVALTLDESIRAASSSVLSRTRLEAMIVEFDLYRSERGLRTSDRKVRQARMEAAIERMRKDIDVDIHPNGQSFEIAYVSPDPQLALKVTGRLASLLIESSLRNRQELNDSAAAFFDAQIDDVRSRLLKRPDVTLPTHPSEVDVRALEHESLKTTYRDLLLKKEQATIAMGMERRQMGQQFKLLEPARLPEAPISPDRARLTLLGAVIGFCAGVAMMLAARNESTSGTKKVLVQP